MQKSPILPTVPWQASEPVISTPTAEAAPPAAEAAIVPYRMLMGVGLTLALTIFLLA